MRYLPITAFASSDCADAGGVDAVDAGVVAGAGGFAAGFVMLLVIGGISSRRVAFTSSSSYSSSGVTATAAFCLEVCFSVAVLLVPIIFGTESFTTGGGTLAPAETSLVVKELFVCSLLFAGAVVAAAGVTLGVAAGVTLKLFFPKFR